MPTRISTTSGVCASLLAVAFWPVVCAGETEIALEASAAKVGKYEKVELVIRLDTQYDNPFDPDQVDVTVLLKTPSDLRLSIPAFFCQEFERRRVGRSGRQTDWLYPVGRGGWKARFAPAEIGTYQAVARLKDRSGTTVSAAVRFGCTPSDAKGFLRVSQRDPRFLEFTEGEPFFAIGQNLAFIGPGQHVKLSKAEEIFQTLSRNGANFLRIWTCCQDWAMAIEARKSAWGRSWGGKPPIVPAPDGDGDRSGRKCVLVTGKDGSALNVAPSHPLAVRPNTGYVFSGKFKTDGKAKLRIEAGGGTPEAALASKPGGAWADFRHEFTTGADQHWAGRIALGLEGEGSAWVSDLSLQEAGGGAELLWEAAVNRPVLGYYNQVDCFMLDQLVEAAQKHGIYLQLCLITRDLYMKSLANDSSDEYGQAIRDAKKLIRYAVARWGHSTAVAAWEYFNEIDPGLPTDRFYEELGKYLEQIDVYKHLRTTSTWHPSPKDWRHPQLDVAQLHHYLRPVSGEAWKDEVAAVLERTRLLKEKTPGGPMLIGEFGLADDRWGRSPYMEQDTEQVHFHNSLWASAMSGASGTALFWWWEKLDAQDAYRHYRPLASFLAGVPWTTAGLKEISTTLSDGKVRLLGLQGKDCAYLWLFHCQATWWNLVAEKTTPAEVQGAKVEIAGLAPGNFRVQWWDTHEGKILREQTVSVDREPLRLAVPAFARDIACRVVR